MTDFAALLQPDQGQSARTIHLVDAKGFDAWFKGQPERARTAMIAARLKPEGYAHAILPGDGADDWSVISIVANAASLSSWCLAKLAAVLPAGNYRLADGMAPGPAPYGWLVGQYSYDRYRKPKASVEGPRILLSNEPAQIAPFVREAEATALVRDLVNAPASDLGPAELVAEVTRVAKAYGATTHVTKGHELERDFPMIHAVGRAATRDRAPRLVTMEWGHPDHPRIAIVGKGVCFDSGGLDIKPASGMALMKKDMGGAAHALGLAQLIMANALPVRLHLVIAAVENAISADAMRPGDILTSRTGLTVEVDNTDAEGRLILADALALAAEGANGILPEIILDFATLTGAARVALGPDLPALFANDDALADALIAGGRARDDAVWRLPLWGGYDEMLKADNADITNSPAGGFAGSITAALFLARFVPKAIAWAHFDTFAWRPAAKPGRTKGGAALGLRAAWTMLEARYRPS